MNDKIFSILVCTYNPDFNKLKQTLFSILIQKNVEFEIIITDDGSKCNYFNEVKDYFNKNQFTKYKLVENKENQGTVKNILSGLKYVSGKYVKLISPGDFLYDENSLASSIEFIQLNPASIYFGNAAYYSKKENVCIFDNKKNPKNITPYKKNNINEIKFNYFVYRDYVLGACFIYETEKFYKYLIEISEFIKYAEDCAVIYMIANNEKIEYIPLNNTKDSYIIWYECDSGISTSGNEKWARIIKNENDSLFCFLTEKNLLPKKIVMLNTYSKFFRWRIKLLFLFPIQFIKRIINTNKKIIGYNLIKADNQKLINIFKE